MAKRERMARLGGRGGLLGGPARARALSPERRTDIARKAARARWARPALVIDRPPRNRGELAALVAHYGSKVARGSLPGKLEDVALHAIQIGRDDPGLARMVPVFLWRARDVLDLDSLVKKAREQGEERAVGYFLELAGTLGRDERLVRAAGRLRPKGPRQAAEYFFARTKRNPFEMMLADSETPPEARRWGLLTGTPTDSFASYFRKVRDL